MRRLIDADVLIHKLKTAIELGQKVDESVTELHAVLGDVESMPTIDAVPVIRCKDCRHAHKGAFNPGYKRCDYNGEIKSPQDFCSWAERKEE